MSQPRQPLSRPNAKAGLKPGATPNTDKSRAADRPVEEEDVFGGAERAGNGAPVKSDGAKP